MRLPVEREARTENLSRSIRVGKDILNSSWVRLEESCLVIRPPNVLRLDPGLPQEFLTAGHQCDRRDIRPAPLHCHREMRRGDRDRRGFLRGRAHCPAILGGLSDRLISNN